MKDLTMEEKVGLWDAINRYVVACGGKTGRNNAIEREQIVAEIARVVDKILNREAQPYKREYKCPECSTHNEVWKKREKTVKGDIVYCWHCGCAVQLN